MMNTLRTLLAAACGFAMLWFYTKGMIVAMNWTSIVLIALLIVPEKQKKSDSAGNADAQNK